MMKILAAMVENCQLETKNWKYVRSKREKSDMQHQ